jgi:hypothetical protein
MKNYEQKNFSAEMKIRKIGSWGRCYDHNFLRFLTIFCKKKLAFLSKTNVMIKILHNLALFRVKNAIFCWIFRRKYFKKS